MGLPGYPVPVFCRLMSLPAGIARRLALLTMRGPEREGRSSMWQDLDRGRGRSEIANLNGAVVRAAEEAGIPCPVNSYLVEVINNLTADPRARDRYKADPMLVVREAPALTARKEIVRPAVSSEPVECGEDQESKSVQNENGEDE
jgi:hypothetical protein